MKTPEIPLSQFRGLKKDKIRSAVRRQWMTWDVKFAVIAKQSERIILADGRKKTLVRCAHCNDLFNKSDIEVNHKNTVGPLRSTEPAEIADYIHRMFRPAAELEALCAACHTNHTTQQRKLH